jgi:hypothetical protein
MASLQAERRQQLEEEQRRFQISRTQKDKIREQFLLTQIEAYTTVRLFCTYFVNRGLPAKYTMNEPFFLTCISHSLILTFIFSPDC